MWGKMKKAESGLLDLWLMLSPQVKRCKFKTIQLWFFDASRGPYEFRALSASAIKYIKFML